MRINLTEKQIEIVAWALDPMTDFVIENEGEPDIYTEEDIPCIIEENGKRVAIEIERCIPMLEDLFYRLEEQLQEMCETEHTAQSYGVAKAAMNATAIIRKALNAEDVEAK